MTDKILEEEAVTALSVAFLIMGEEPPSGGLAEETGQPIQGSRVHRIPKPLRSLHLKVLILSALLVPSELCFLKHCQIKGLWETHLYPNKQVSHISL